MYAAYLTGERVVHSVHGEHDTEYSSPHHCCSPPLQGESDHGYSKANSLSQEASVYGGPIGSFGVDIGNESDNANALLPTRSGNTPVSDTNNIGPMCDYLQSESSLAEPDSVSMSIDTMSSGITYDMQTRLNWDTGKFYGRNTNV